MTQRVYNAKLRRQKLKVQSFRVQITEREGKSQGAEKKKENKNKRTEVESTRTNGEYR